MTEISWSTSSNGLLAHMRPPARDHSGHKPVGAQHIWYLVKLSNLVNASSRPTANTFSTWPRTEIFTFMTLLIILPLGAREPMGIRELTPYCRVTAILWYMTPTKLRYGIA